MLKDSKLYSILANRCPKCHKGKFFQNDNPYKLKSFDKYPKNCKVCGESFEREIGFYYGAMYLSYGITVILGLLWFCIFIVLLNMSISVFLMSFLLILLLLFPWVFRTGRLAWINLFVKYDKNAGIKE